MIGRPVPCALGWGTGPRPLEATYGYYWAADLLKEAGAAVHLVHPLGLHWDNRRPRTMRSTPPS